MYKRQLLGYADGDGRRLLNVLEQLRTATATAGRRVVSADFLEQTLAADLRRFDKGGDAFYDQISAPVSYTHLNWTYVGRKENPMQTVNIHEAKTHLSRFVDQAAAGEEIIIARAGKPVARLVPLVPVACACLLYTSWASFRPRLAATPLPFSLPSALQTWPSDFHRRSNAPCPAHTS